MAVALIEKPGTKYGPCKTECKHIHCAESRKFATMICEFCNKPIGYQRNFFQRENWKKLIHAVCAHEEEENKNENKS